MHEVMRNRSITKGICMTTSEFSAQAEIFCQSRPLELWDKKILIKKLGGVL
jgi:hypothetical protein